MTALTVWSRTAMGAFARLGRRRERLMTGVVIAVSLGLAFLSLRTSYFQGDDFLNFATARENGLRPSWLGSPLFGHWLPGRRALDWSLSLPQPVSWELALIVLLLFLGCTAFLVSRCAALLGVGPGLSAAAGVAVVFSGATTGTLQWYAGAAQVIPASAFALAATHLILQSHRTSGLRRLLVLTGAGTLTAAGLVFDERTAVVVGIAPLLLLFGAGPGRRRSIVAAYLLLVPLLTIWYLVQDRFVGEAAARAELVPVASIAYLALAAFGSVAAGLIGFVSRPSPLSPWGLVIVGVVVVAALSWAASRGRSPLRAWGSVGLASATVVAVHLPVAVFRVAEFGVSSALEPRYSAMAVPLVVLCAAFVASRLRPTPGSARAKRIVVASVAVTVGVNLVVLALTNTGVTTRRWLDNLTAGRHDTAATAFYNVPVAPEVVPGAFYPYNMTASVLPLLLDGASTRVTSDSAALVRSDGNVEVREPSGSRAVEVAEATGMSRSSPGCWIAEDDQGRIWFDYPFSPGSGDTRVVVVTGTFPSEGVRLLSGPEPSNLRDKTNGLGGHPPVAGAGTWVTSEEFGDARVFAIEVPRGARLCLGGVEVGVVSP